MGWLARLGFVAAGLCVALLAHLQLKAGHITFQNASYHQTTFAASGYGIGILLVALAFLPSRAWVYEHITTRTPPPAKFLVRRRRAKRVSR